MNHTHTNMFSSMDARYFKQILSLLTIPEIALLASTSKEVRNRVRQIMLTEMNLSYSDSKWRISKNFFQILKNNYYKKVIKISKSDFVQLLKEPTSKEVKYEIKDFFPGQRILQCKAGPKLVGYLTDRHELFLLPLSQLDGLAFEKKKIIKDVIRFEVGGWCIVEKKDHQLFSITHSPDMADGFIYSETQLPNYHDEQFSCLSTWSSNFDHVAVVYRASSLTNEHFIYISSASSEVDPMKIGYNGTVHNVSLTKKVLYISDGQGALHVWNFEKKLEYSKIDHLNVKDLYSNSILSVLITKNNKVKKLEDFTNEDLVEWFRYLKLSKFEDTIKYSKLTGKQIEKFDRQEFEKLLGFPYDSPEINHLYLHNRLISKGFYKTPEVIGHGYNGNNELGINTGNNVVQDYQDFKIELNDFTDNIADIKICGVTSFLTTLKGRLFSCIEAEDKQTDSYKLEKADKNNNSRKNSKAKDMDEDSDSEEEPGNKSKGKKKTNKKSQSHKPEGISGEKKQSTKKFEKVRWREITDVLGGHFQLKKYHIDMVDTSRLNIFLVCHEKHKLVNEEFAKNHLLAIGTAVNRVLNDPKLNMHIFDVGMRHS